MKAIGDILKKMKNYKKEIEEVKLSHIYYKLPNNDGFRKNKQKAKELKAEIENDFWSIQQYADIDDALHWKTSTITQKEAQNEADRLAKLLIEINKIIGKEKTYENKCKFCGRIIGDVVSDYHIGCYKQKLTQIKKRIKAEIKQLEKILNPLREKIIMCNFCGEMKKPTNLDYYEQCLVGLQSQLELIEELEDEE